jgi:hypothetical protein
MEGVGVSSFDLDLGRRVLIMIIFLVGMWYVLNLIVSQIKSGKMKIPPFLLNKFPALRNIDHSQYTNSYDIKIIQRQVMTDGYEMIVIEINERHILLSKHIQSGVQYITDLK